MSSPIKPWEGAGVNSRANTPIRSSLNPRPATPYGDRPNLIRGSSSTTTVADSVPDCCKTAPPVPSRPPRSTYGSATSYNGGMFGNYGGYGNSMYGYGSGMYGSGYGSGYGMYGGYGGYGGYGRYSSYGNQAIQSSPFVRRAEESSQAAFQSVESIVHAFGSISMMLESTHFAMLNTFRAVLGAADHFSQMKSHILNAIGAIAIIKTLKALCQKVLYMLGFIRNSGIENEVWTQAVNSSVAGAVSDEERGKTSTKSWPIVIFFAVIVGVPWVIWKMLKSFIAEEDYTRAWKTGTGDHILARVEYDFVGQAQDELSVSAGSIIKIAPKDQQPLIRGWLLASVDGEKEGIIPANYVKILGLRRGTNINPDGTPSVPSGSECPCPSNHTLQASSSGEDLGANCCSPTACASTTSAPNKIPELDTLDFEMAADTEMDLPENIPT